MVGTKFRLADFIWPTALADLNRLQLLSLDDLEFAELRRRFFRRALKLGVSRGRAKLLSRRVKLVKFPRAIASVPLRLMNRRRKDSVLLDTLAKDRRITWKPLAQRKKRSSFNLENFSFLNHPVETLTSLKKIAEAEAEEIGSRVNFLDAEVDDIAPYLVWALMKRDMVPFMNGGRISTKVRCMLQAVDLDVFTNMDLAAPSQQDPHFHAFRLRQKRRHGTSGADNLPFAASTKEKTATDLTETVNEWLAQGDPPHELSPDASSWLYRIVSETLDNAERHSQINGDGDWSIAGFMTRSGDENSATYSCHIAVVSLGLSVSQSISSASGRTKEGLEAYCKRHEKGKSNRDALALVYALQDSVSRLSGGGNDSGGVGMMDLVQFTNELGKRAISTIKPQITIVSGDACVKFCDAYSSFGASTDSDINNPNRRRLQFFNLSNSIDIGPSSDHVFRMPLFFPGTIITVGFGLPAVAPVLKELSK